MTIANMSLSRTKSGDDDVKKLEKDVDNKGKYASVSEEDSEDDDIKRLEKDMEHNGKHESVSDGDSEDDDVKRLEKDIDDDGKYESVSGVDDGKQAKINSSKGMQREVADRALTQTSTEILVSLQCRGSRGHGATRGHYASIRRRRAVETSARRTR